MARDSLDDNVTLDAPSLRDVEPVERTAMPSTILDATKPSVIDSLGYDPAKMGEVASSLAGAKREQMGAQSYIDREMIRRSEEDRTLMRRAYDAEGEAKGAIPPAWNADKERADRIRGPIESFGTIGSIFAMIASTFTKTPMTSALNAGAAAMTAIREHDEKGYESAYAAWKANTDLALKRFEMEREAFQDANKLLDTDLKGWETRTRMNAARFGDQQTLALLDAGMVPEILEVQAKLIDTAAKLEKTKEGVEEFNLRSTLFRQGKEAFKQANPNATQEEDVRNSLELLHSIKAAERGLMTYNTLKPEQQYIHQRVQELIRSTADGGPGLSPAEALRQAEAEFSAAKRTGTGTSRDQSVRAIKEELKKEHEGDPAWTDARIAEEAEKRVGQARLGMGGDSARTPEALRAAAERYLKTGQFPPGMGGLRGSPDRIRIENEAAALAKERGINMSDLPKKWQEFKAEQIAIQRFLSGPQGNTITSLSVAVDHLQTLKELSTALKNGKMRVFNAVAQSWAEETGNPAPTDFDTAKQIIGSEIIKAIGVAGAGTQSERHEAANAMNRARSPAQIDGAITVVQKLLDGQLRGKKQQFITATGLPGARFDEMLSDEARRVYDSLRKTKPAPKPAAPDSTIIRYDAEGNRIP